MVVMVLDNGQVLVKEHQPQDLMVYCILVEEVLLIMVHLLWLANTVQMALVMEVLEVEELVRHVDIMKQMVEKEVMVVFILRGVH